MGQFPHESLTAIQAEALTILAEECAELAQECSKMLRSGFAFCRKGGDVPNTVFFGRELFDVIALMAIVEASGMPDPGLDVEELALAKVERLKNWSNLGALAAEVLS